MTLRCLAPVGAGKRARLAPWVRVTAAALLVWACAAEPQSSGTAAVPRIPPPSEQHLAIGAEFRAQHAQLLNLAAERYPHIVAGSLDGTTLITLMLDDEGHVTASDFVNVPSHQSAGPADVEIRRLFDQHPYEFFASHGVPLEQARASTWFGGMRPPNGRLYASAPSTPAELIFAVYDPARRMTPDSPVSESKAEAIRAIVTQHFPELYENATSRGGDTRECIWALMDSSGDLLTAGREPEPENDRERAQVPPEYCGERARILEARYPGIEIGDSPKGEYILGRDWKPLHASDGTSLVLMVYWLDLGSPLP